ncbi:dephospho-CoA kinase [Streptococcus sp. zg-JUN1979]|uniref:dephospho-CoA kinase n=1 Tax=Streptococcus sp. zg-JUN1979 TaxID=3391450 RepID=UPI0039A41EF7
MTRLIGITGGIASGKSTVTSLIKQAGYTVIDADKLVHDLQQKGGRLYNALLEQFGRGILAENGELDRPKLAQLIFSDEAKRRLSNQVQDDVIKSALANERDKAMARISDVVFMDIPLLIEKGYVSWFDEIWLVSLDEDKQLERLMKRNHYSLSDAKQRLKSQMILSEKRPYASHMIDNNGTKSELEALVKAELLRLDKWIESTR